LFTAFENGPDAPDFEFQPAHPINASRNEGVCMDVHYLKTGLLLVLITLPLAAWGASAPATETLSWTGCVKITENQNSTLLSARKQIESKQDLYHSSYNSVLPGLSLNYGFSDSSADVNQWQQQLQGTVQWDLFNWKDYAGIQLSSAVLSEAQCQGLLTSAQVRFQLRNAFYQLLYAQNQIALLEHIRQLRLTNSQMVTLEYNSGRESKGNMLITKADFASTEADLVQAQRNLRVAQQALNLIMGRDEATPVEVHEDFYLPVAPHWEDITAHLPGLPQVRRDEAVVAESRASVQQAVSQVLPNVSASYSRGRFGQSFLQNNNGLSFPNNDEWSTSVNLSWPIFSGGPTASFYSISSAQEQLTKSEADKQADLQQLRATAENAWAGLMQGIDQVAVQKQYLEAVRQRNDEATIEYSNGLLTFENWNQVVTQLVTYEKQYLSSRLNAVLAENTWNNAFEITLEEQ
jgi:outer membrane protein TolC